MGFPDIGFPDIGFSEIGFPDIGFPDIGFPDIGFPDIGFPDIGFPDIGFPNIAFPERFEAKIVLLAPVKAIVETNITVTRIYDSSTSSPLLKKKLRVPENLIDSFLGIIKSNSLCM